MAAVAPDFATAAVQHYNRLKARNAGRDNMHAIVHHVREGGMRKLFPSELNLSLSFDGVPIANFVDIVARDMAEAIAPLPSLACVSGKMRTDADQKRAEVKNRIGDNYWSHSNLETQMLRGADRYITYGFVPFFLEPDVDNKIPFIQVEDPRHCYYELDRYGCVTVYAKRWMRTVDELCAQFPEYENVIRRDPATRSNRNPDGIESSGDTELELVRWVDKTNVSLMLPSRNGLVLGSYAHKMEYAPVWIAERPGESDKPRGQFDDVIWIQVARAIMSTLALEAAHIAVQSPIAVPADMDEFPVGPHAILQSDNPQGIHKVGLELPPNIFAENQVLDQELKTGSRYPDARTGGVQASVITGKGVEALLGTFDTQIKGAQMVMRRALEKITAMAFEFDELWWPNVSKTIAGTLAGASWEATYTPRDDIAGRYNCTVTYGFAAGMHPSQSIVTMLQLEGAGAIAKGTMQENLPFDIDQVAEQKKINVERARDALSQGLFQLVQSSGQMVAQGQDPMPVLNLSLTYIKGLQDGKTVEQAMDDAFTAMQQAQQQAAAAAQAQQGPDQGAPPDAGALGGDAGGPTPGVAPGQAGLPPGGLATVSQLIAGFRGNASNPVNQATVRRMIPTGGQ